MNKVLITSQGRTATVSLNDYLNDLPEVVSYHERRRSDVQFLFYSQQSDYEVLTKAHLDQENEFAKACKFDHYVAVNPYYRFAGALLKEHYGWNVAHIVRHPKSYLESVFVRKTLGPNDVILQQLPKDSDRFAAHWPAATRFEKLCWYYGNTLAYFAQSDIAWYPFESITSDGEALSKMIADLGLPTGGNHLQLKQKNSRYSVENPLRALKKMAKNSPSKALQWSQLSERELETYHSTFIDLAKHFGYVL